jgi:hypothetical protein
VLTKTYSFVPVLLHGDRGDLLQIVGSAAHVAITSAEFGAPDRGLHHPVDDRYLPQRGVEGVVGSATHDVHRAGAVVAAVKGVVERTGIQHPAGAVAASDELANATAAIGEGFGELEHRTATVDLAGERVAAGGSVYTVVRSLKMKVYTWPVRPSMIGDSRTPGVSSRASLALVAFTTPVGGI